MNHLNEVIKKFNDTTYNNPDSVELNEVYDLIRSASQTKCEIAFPSNVVLEVCKIYLNKVFGFYVGDNVDESALKQHLLIIHTLLTIPQAGHEECTTGIIQEIVMLIFDPSCNFWLCLHLVKLANKILIMQNNVFKRKNIGYGAIKNYHLCRLMDHLFTCGDYVLQSSILELLFRLKRDIQNLTVDLFPEDFDLQRALNKINSATFDIDCRHFLNTVNQNSKRVFSLQAEFITADGRSLLPPSDFLDSSAEGNSNLWVDFNKDSQAITINVSLNCIVPVKLNEEDSDAVLMIINEHAIDKFSRKKLKKDHMNLDLLIINLSHSIVINNRICKTFAKKCKLIKIAFKSNARANLLHDEVLGEIFKNKSTSKSKMTSSSTALNRNPLPINVISNNSKSIYTSISEKSLGYLIRKDASELNQDSEKFDTCPDKINVVSNSIDLNIPKASRKKRTKLTKSRRRKMSILDSISEDEEYHSEQIIHSTLKSGLVMVSTSVNFSDVTSIHTDSNKGTVNSRSLDAQKSATNSKSDVEIDGNRFENQLEQIDVLSNSSSNLVEKARFFEEDTSLKQNIYLESAVQSLGNEQIEPIPSGSMKTMMQPPTVDQTAVKFSNEVKVASSNSRLLSSRTNSEVSKVSQGSRYNTRSKKKVDSAIVVLDNMVLPINKDRFQIYNKTRKVSLSLRKRSSGRLSLPDEEKIVKSPEQILAKKNDLPEENEVKISSVENIESDRDIARNIIIDEPKLVKNIKKVDVLEKATMDDIVDDSRKNSSNHSIKEPSQDFGKDKELTKSAEVAGSSNEQSIKVNCNEESQLKIKSSTVPEIVNSLTNEKQTITDNTEQTTSPKDRSLNQFNADEEEIIENTANEILMKNPSGKGRKKANKNKPLQESSKSNVDSNQPIIKSQVIENYQEIASLACEVWDQVVAKCPKRRRRQNNKISKTSEKQLKEKSIRATCVKIDRNRVAKSEATSQLSEGASENKLNRKDTSENRNADLMSTKSKVTNVDRSTNVSLKSCTISSTEFAKKYTKLLQERSQINKTIFNRRKSQSESDITTKKSTKRRKLYTLNETVSVCIPADKPQSECNEEEEEINELTQEEMDSKTYLFNKLISREDSQTSKKLQKPDEPSRTECDESRTDQQIGQEHNRPERPPRSCANRRIDRKIEMSNCNKKMSDGMIRKKYVRRMTKKMKNISTIPINSIVSQNEGDLFDKLCQTNITEQSTRMQKHNSKQFTVHNYEIMIAKIKNCYSKADKLMRRLVDTVRHDQERMNMLNT